jgi:glycine betaine/proline transport system ATP-binding protein
MKPPSRRITADTIAEALVQMKAIKGDYGYYVNDDGYQGVVTQDALEACCDDASQEMMDDTVWEDLPGISPDAMLESVIPETLDADYSLPVVDEEGNLKGELSKSNLADVLGGTERKPEERV